MKSNHPFSVLRILILSIGALILIACGSPATNGTPSPSAAITGRPPATEVQTTTREAPTPTTLPSRTLVLLIASPGADAESVSELTDTFTELAASTSLDFEVRPTISQEDLSPNMRLVIALPPDPGLADLAGAAPQTQFLGISIPGLEPAHNLSVINSEGISPDRIGFLAGYLTAVVTPEWRVGALTTNDTTDGLAHRQGFLNGAVFFCGLCQQTYPPFNSYPMYVEASSSTDPQEWLTFGSILVDQAVHSAYLAPGADHEALLAYLAEAGINLVGVIPPPPGLEDQWIATISGDIVSSIHAIWPDLIAGQGGVSIAAPLTVTHINPELFSPGRQRLVEKLINELANGFIDTGVLTDSGAP